MLEGFKKSWCGWRRTVSMGNSSPHDISFPIGYKIEISSQLARFCNMKFTFNIIMYFENSDNFYLKKTLPLEMLILSIKWLLITLYSRS